MKTLSKYGRIFDPHNPYWTKNTEYNLMFLRSRQAHLNDMLKSCGHLFLNEAYDMLGFPRTASGAIAGWIYRNDNKLGDNFVDLGICECGPLESGFMVDFNVIESIIN